VIDQHHGIPGRAAVVSDPLRGLLHEVLGPIWAAFYPCRSSELGQWQERWTHRLYRHVPFWTASNHQGRLHAMACARSRLFLMGFTRSRCRSWTTSADFTVRLAASAGSPLTSGWTTRLRAVKCLLERGVDAEDPVVGTGEAEAVRAQVAGELALVHAWFSPGRCPSREKDALLRRAHVLLPYLATGGLGLNVIEANAMGTPAVVYPVAGLVDRRCTALTGLVARTKPRRAR